MHAADVSIGDDESVNNRLNKKLEELDTILREIYGTTPSTLEGYGTGLASLAAIAAVLNNETTTINDRVSTSVTAEANDRIAADNELQSNLDDLSTALADESQTRSADDITLQNNIDAEISNRTTAVQNEKEAREQADTTLQQNIDNEVSARTSADSTEQQARIDADSALEDRIEVIELDYLQADDLTPYITETDADTKYQPHDTTADPYVFTSVMQAAIEQAIVDLLQDYNLTLIAPSISAAVDTNTVGKIDLTIPTFHGIANVWLDEKPAEATTWTALTDTIETVSENPISYTVDHNSTYRAHMRRTYRGQSVDSYSNEIIISEFEEESPEEP